jgi:protein TonB
VLRLTLFVIASASAHAAALLIPGHGAPVDRESASAAPEDPIEIDLLGPTDALERVEAAPGPVGSSPGHVPPAAPLEHPRVRLATPTPRAMPSAAVALVDAPAIEPSPRDDADEVPPIAVRTRSAPSGAPAFSPPSAAADVAAPGDAPLPVTSVDGRARLLHGVAPAYPAQARADGVEGTVRLELVVDASGSLESARVVRSAGHGLDEAALAAAKQFHFTPATKGGRAVRVRMGWSIDFRFRD